MAESNSDVVVETSQLTKIYNNRQIALNDVHIPSFLVIGFQYDPWFNTTQDTPDKCSEAALDGVGRTTLRYIYAH